MHRSFFARLFSLSFLAVTAMAAALSPAACGSDEDSSSTDSSSASGPGCPGGVVIDGKCEGKCTPAACLQGDAGESPNTCVGNTCALRCTSHADCFNLNNGKGFPPSSYYLQHTQDCTAATEDDTAAPVQVCKSNNKARGFGYACPDGTECTDYKAGFACPNGAPCNGPGAPSCIPTDVNADGVEDNVCLPDLIACRGNAACVIGRCQIDQSPCSITDQCAPNECTQLSCLTTGVGDADAYCTKFDCKEDVDCPGGFYCGAVRVGRDICGVDDKGPSAYNFCGESDEPCLAAADFTKDGANYFEGPTCLMRRVCMKREPCATCASDLDCSLNPDLRCSKNGDATTTCGKLCNPANGDDDCDPDYRCDVAAPVVPNPEGLGTCVHRFGACKGTGAFCDPCLDDRDCGESTCLAGSGNQQACFHFPFDLDCTTDTDCPESKGGVNGTCLDEAEGVAPSSSAYHKCYLPIDAASNKTGCW